ncbi:MAG: polysaccharide deacetylase family protein [Clostridia bacterium]|nr:polysaccharide deacetylase family protein [Clostridia bacterium]
MQNGRFGPIETNDKPKKSYRVDYNRLITVIMIAVIIILGIVIWKDAKKEPEEIPGLPQTALTAAGAPDVLNQTDENVFSPEELRPVAEEEGLLPVFRRANTSEKKVAIVVDTFDNAGHIDTLLGLAGTFGAKITFVPTGVELRQHQGAWVNVAFAGHEIENHTMDNTRLSTLADEDKAENILEQTEILKSIVGSDYSPHFLSTNDLEDDADAFLHSWLAGNGYLGILRWDERVPSSFDKVVPGAILSYPLTDAGMKALSNAIPILSENGYQMVTMNELFDYPDNMRSSPETAG